MNTKKLDTGSKDAISLLPDELRSEILSLLPKKLAASTSLLSKKWRNVFRLLPYFDFDGYVSIYPENVKRERGESLRKFLKRTHCHDSSPFKKFSLKREIRDDIEMAYVTSWICDAVDYGVLEVDLNIAPCVRRSLPSQLFTSKTLVKLTLGTYRCSGERVSCVFLELPSYVSLPSLKILFVDTVFFTDRELSDVLLAGCPVLEDVTIYHNDDLVPHTIISPSVKRLLLDYTSPRKPGYAWMSDHLSLDLPNLVYLDYSGFAMVQYPQANLDSLVEAKLDLHSLEDNDEAELMLYSLEDNDNETDITNLIAGISNVEILHLSRESVYVISLGSKQRLPLLMFNNLVNLSFGSKNKQGWEVLAYLLNQSPKLENLIIQDMNGYTLDIYVPANKVKALHVLGYRGNAEESKQLKSFLGKFECLELVQVNVTQEDDGRILQTKRDQLMMLLGVSLPSKCEFRVA